MNQFLPEGANEAQVKAVLARELPALEVNRLEMVTSGWDNTVAIADGRWVFRFPKDGEYAFQAETALLMFLEGKLSVPIPKPTHLGKQVQMMGYAIIPGRFLSETEVGALDTEACRRLGEELARFLWELHQHVSPAQGLAMGWGQKRIVFDREAALAAVRACCPELCPAAERAADSIGRLRLEQAPCFLYNDLHIDNFLVDDQGHLCGFIDFGDCAVGDPHFEFYGLWRYNPALFEATVSAYEVLSGLKLDRAICQALAWEDCLSDLLELKNKPENPGHQNALRWMRRWAGMPEELRRST